MGKNQLKELPDKGSNLGLPNVHIILSRALAMPKSSGKKFLWSFIFGSIAIGAWGGIISGAEPPLSRDMQLGIFYFKKGEDSEAMDRFIEVLNGGSPSEQALANKYLNRITRRMSGTEPAAKPASPASETKKTKTKTKKTNSAPSKAPPVSRSIPAESNPKPAVSRTLPSSSAAVAPKASPVSRPVPKESSSKPASSRVSESSSVAATPQTPTTVQAPPVSPAVLQREIKGQIKNLTVSGLNRLKRIHRIIVLSKKDGRPWAIAVPSDILFKKQVAFKNNAEQIISNLASVSYGEGKAKVFVFPEGAALGDVKVIAMRRAVAVADSLVSLGISPSRVQAELLTGSSYRIPSSLLSFKGIILVFDYHETLDLKAPPDEDGPPLSLGLSSSRFRADKGQGALIEFSIEKPRSGVRFWKFKILGPENNKPKTIEEVVGSGPVFHQVYWDGRKNYSGTHEPYGFYECFLTAEDGAGRTRSIHRWVELAGPPGTQNIPKKKHAEHTQPKVVKKSSLKRRVAAKVSSSFTRLHPVKKSFHGQKKVAYVELHSRYDKKMVRRVRRKKRRSKAQYPRIVEEIPFKANSYQMSRAMKNKILKLSRRMVKNRKAGYDIIGYAKPAEKNAKNLCRQRAQIVAGLLINKYRISLKRLRIRGEILKSKGERVVIVKRAVVKKRRAQKRGRKTH